MKLLLKIPTTASRLIKIRLEPQWVELWDAYLAYYKIQLGTALTAEQVITEMIMTFIKSDRDFMRWYRERPAQGNSSCG